MEKLKMHTPNITAENVEKLAALFPNCVTETRDEKTGQLKLVIDFDQLHQELSDHVVDGPRERYHLDWPGKREALLAANAPIAKTLRPCREESVDFDTTKNLFIEGDNLDALKLLQETYLGKVKMIYIDPPYNTGGDFLYDDDFSENASDYLSRSQQVGTDGARLNVNTELNGRFHSDWLTHIYPRLKIARNLLASDGSIFISINDREIPNLRKVCDEIFGEHNLLGCIVWKNATDNNPSIVVVEHEYVLVVCKDHNEIETSWQSAVSDVKQLLVNKGKELVTAYHDPDKLQAAYTVWFRKHKAELWPLDGYKYIDAGGVYAGIRGVHNPGKEGYRYDVIHPETGRPCKQPLMGYRFPEETMKRLLDEKKIIFGDDHNKLIELKAYAHEYQEKLSSVIELDGRSGAYDLRTLFPEFKTAFKNPKPVNFLQRFLSLTLKTNGDIVLDFYAGSSTTAHATMELCRNDGITRRFIMVQLPEPCGPDSEPAKAGILTIADLSKERIRRAGQKTSADQEKFPRSDGGVPPSSDIAEKTSKSLDIGFRVLKIDTSNMKDVYYAPDEMKQDQLALHTDNIKENRTPEDLLFQVLVDWGVDLALPIAQETIAGKTVFFVDGNALAACFDSHISEDLVKELAKRKPLRAVFRDSSYNSDSTKINVEQIFTLLSPASKVKSL